MLRYQVTIRNEMTCTGIGLHSGQPVSLTLRPAPVDTGIVFLRRDLNNSAVRATAANTAATRYATTIRQNGISVRTVEHLLAACAGVGITNLYVDLDAEEVPILDGSAGPFIRMIVDADMQRQDKVQPVLKVTRPLFVRDGSMQLAIWPAERTSISFFIGFDHPLVREQSFTCEMTEENFIREIADARTFGFLRDVEGLQVQGLVQGGSLKNAVVLGEDTVLNDEGLRYRDEFVRHKVLDIIGDLALVGMPVIGHVVAHKSGHSLNAQMATKLLQSPTNWVLVGDPELAKPRRTSAAYQESMAY